MNVLLIGSGGREHALAWKIAQSKKLDNLYIVPGNAGTSHCGVNVNLAETDFEGIKKLVWEKSIDMVVVGPEAPLTKGIHDFFLADELLREIPVIGPKKDGAILEASKDFSKQFLIENNIPTAAYKTFTKDSLNEALAFLGTLQPPYVLKADGLAAGKGVIISNTLEEAEHELTEMLTHSKFGEASSKVVIEEFLSGIELSVFILTDGKNYKILPTAKDYKRIGENDTGLNTGGMGAISPVPFADEEFMNKVEQRIIIPTVEGLNKRGIEYKGFIFIGLMNRNGDPYVIEYNCRMGDPETEVVIPRIKTDILDLFEAVSKNTLNLINLETDHRYAATVMLVSGGYPEAYEKGKIISKIDHVENCMIFHAGTTNKGDDILTNGGRVIAVTSMHDNLNDAIGFALTGANKIEFHGKYFRKDIGQDLLSLM